MCEYKHDASLSIVRTGFPKAAKVRKSAKNRRQTLTLVKVSAKTGKVILRFTVGFIKVSENTFISIIGLQ